MRLMKTKRRFYCSLLSEKKEIDPLDAVRVIPENELLCVFLETMIEKSRYRIYFLHKNKIYKATWGDSRGNLDTIRISIRSSLDEIV